MQLQTAISCLNYDDFLACTLPRNLPYLQSVTVVTSPRDPGTIRLAKQLGVQLFITDAWHVDGPLNKALALNQWITHASAFAPDAWLMTLDADILLFNPVFEALDRLDPACLYSVRRRMCADFASFNDFLSGNKALEDFPLDIVPVRDGKLWGTVQAQNPAALAGFFQLWSPAHALGAKRFQGTGSAEAYDILFGLSFPEAARKFLPSREALHLGPTEINWAGRRSPRWSKP
jgi:hypothetical protein